MFIKKQDISGHQPSTPLPSCVFHIIKLELSIFVGTRSMPLTASGPGTIVHLTAPSRQVYIMEHAIIGPIQLDACDMPIGYPFYADTVHL